MHPFVSPLTGKARKLLKLFYQDNVCVLIKLHLTAQPSPVIPIFECYKYGSTLWGISGYHCNDHF